MIVGGHVSCTPDPLHETLGRSLGLVRVFCSHLRYYHETKTLLKSEHQICAIDAGGEQIRHLA